MATTPPSSQDINEIRRHMAQIRRELHEDMQNVVLGAEAVADWQRYIRLYPWLSVGLAFAAGFLIVPKRRPSRAEIAEEAVERNSRTRATRRRGADGEVVVEAPAENLRKKSKFGLLGMAFGMMAPILTRVAQNYASNYLETLLAQQHMVPPSAAQPGPGPGAGPGPSAGWPGQGPRRP